MPPEPFGGQKVCPVSGDPLGERPLAVETSLGKANQQPFWKRMFNPAPAKGLTIYVCCQGCAAKVRTSPGEYFLKVLDEKNRAKPR